MPESVNRIFDTPEHSQLVVENIRGAITVSGWDRPQIEISAIPGQEWAQVEISQHGNKVVARTKTEHGQGKWSSWFSGDRAPRVEYSAKVPYASDLEIKNVTGPITIRHCKGVLSVRTVDGNVTLEHTEGDVSAETVNGSLSANHLQGQARLKTVNGEQSLEESALSGLTAQTVNGRIKAAAAWDKDAQISLHSVNGDCHVVVPADFRASASAHGINVSVTCGQAATVSRHFSGWQGTVGPPGDGDPQAQITFHTVNGHLRIDDDGPPSGKTDQFVKRAAADKPPAPAETETEPVQVKAAQEPPEQEPKSQIDVLRMVERGEMTVEEAIEALET